MALINCTECGHTVSTKAAACPNCGVPVAGTVSVPSAREQVERPEPVVSKPWKLKVIAGVVLVLLLQAGAGYVLDALAGSDAEEQAVLEAEERGFASVDEMRNMQQRGFQTKADHVEAQQRRQQREQAEARERQLAEERARAPSPYLAAQTSEIVAKVE